MFGHIGIRGVLACATLASLGTAGCASAVARIQREAGDGPVLIDRDRPIVLLEAAAGVEVSIPLLFREDTRGFLGPCSVRAVEVDEEVADSLASADTDELGPDLLDELGPTLLNTDTSVVRVRSTGVHVTSSTKRLGRRELGDVDQLDGGLYVELAADQSQQGLRVCPQLTGPIPHDSVRVYLIRFGSVRGVEGTGVAFLGLLFGAIVLTFVR